MFISGMEVRSSLIFGRIWIDIVGLCVYSQTSVGLGDFVDEKYFQSFCWHYVKSWLDNVLLSCQQLLFLLFQRLLPLRMEIYYWVDVSMAWFQNFYTLIKMKFFIIVGVFVLKVPLCINLWGCLFVLFNHLTEKIASWLKFPKMGL